MRRLLCISNSIADTFKWRSKLKLTNNDIAHFSPYADPTPFRNYDPRFTAIVWIDRPTLDALHHDVIEDLKARGVKEYTEYDHTLIRLWLERAGRRAHFDAGYSMGGGVVPVDEENARRAYDCGEYVVDRLVQIMVVAATCWAIEQRGLKLYAEWLRRRNQRARAAGRPHVSATIRGRIEGEEAAAAILETDWWKTHEG